MSSDGSRVSGQEGKVHMLCSLCGRNDVRQIREYQRTGPQRWQDVTPTEFS